MCVIRLQPVPYLLQVEVVTRMAMQVFSNASTWERRAKGSVRSSVAAQRSRDNVGHTAEAPKLGRWGMCCLQMARETMINFGHKPSNWQVTARHARHAALQTRVHCTVL